MDYGIMRVEKRSRSSIYGLQIENNRQYKDHEKGREFYASDIDWSKTKNNIFLVHTPNWNEEITRQIKQNNLKTRKDSIVALDAIYTFSQSWQETHSKQEMMDYFKSCLDFHIKEYCGGDKSLVINCVIHMDEQSPHMHTMSIPICHDEKGPHLSAKTIMGNKNDYRKRQDKFYEEVSSKFGMDRGEIHDPKEIKKHITKKEWKIKMQKQEINELEVKKELLDFDISSQRSTLNYEKSKVKEELETISSKVSKMALESDKLQDMRNKSLDENIALIRQNKALKRQHDDLTNELSSLKEIIFELNRKCEQLKGFIERNVNRIREWRDDVTNKIEIANKKINEYIALSNEFERYQIKEIHQAALAALGDVPNELDYDYDYDMQDTYETNDTYNSYDEEEWEL